MSTTLRLNFWSSPRNISTAIMYSFAQRADTTVVDEPLYAHYLLKTNSTAAHPGTAEILTTQENDGNQVVKKVILGDYPTPIVLFKQMTHHLIHLDETFLGQTDHVLLIRDPKRIIASYNKVIPNPTIHDIGVKMQLTLCKKLQKLGRLKAIVDAKELLLNPRIVLMQLCEKIGIPFDSNMLQWQPGARPEDGVWAKYWYSNVHQSTGFQPYVEKKVELPEHLQQLAEACDGYYQELFQLAIKHELG